MNNKIGITEGADPTVNPRWVEWVEAGKPAILITKMPRLLLPRLSPNYNIIVHCTITGLGGTPLERSIDNYETSLKYYHDTCKLLGSERVVLRIDPIVRWYWEDSACALQEVSREAEGRVRISFMDLYPHVKTRLQKVNLVLTQTAFHQPLDERRYIWEALGKPEVCAEPGPPSTPCVSKVDCEILGVRPSLAFRGQRKECRCLANKTELCKPPPKCVYGCLYCYWR